MQRLLFMLLACCLCGTTTLFAQLSVPDTVHFGDHVLPTRNVNPEYQTQFEYKRNVPFINNSNDTIYIIGSHPTPNNHQNPLAFYLFGIYSFPFENGSEVILLPNDTIYFMHSFMTFDPLALKDSFATVLNTRKYSYRYHNQDSVHTTQPVHYIINFHKGKDSLYTVGSELNLIAANCERNDLHEGIKYTDTRLVNSTNRPITLTELNVDGFLNFWYVQVHLWMPQFTSFPYVMPPYSDLKIFFTLGNGTEKFYRTTISATVIDGDDTLVLQEKVDSYFRQLKRKSRFFFHPSISGFRCHLDSQITISPLIDVCTDGEWYLDSISFSDKWLIGELEVDTNISRTFPIQLEQNVPTLVNITFDPKRTGLVSADIWAHLRSSTGATMKVSHRIRTNVYSSPPVSVEENIHGKLFSVSPNPVGESFLLTNNSPATADYSIVDILGREIARGTMIPQQQQMLSSAAWTAGAYFIVVSNRSAKETLRIFKTL